MSKELPLEGYFACGGDGGRGLFMTPDCLGRDFTSRTANYDLIIGLPQLDTFLKPPGKVLPPQWTYGPPDAGSRERVNDRDRDPFFWGRCVGYHIGRINVHIFRCRFSTSLTVSTAEEFDAAVEDFLSELEDWWTRFTSWVGILTSQDFVVLGGYPGAVTRAGSVSIWTSDSQQRVEMRYPTRDHRIKISPLELHDLKACVTATGNQGVPPAEWLFIRDARSHLDAGQNRRAVIDAATAAEIAMTTLIDKYLATANTDELVRTALTERYKALEGRTQLLKRLRSELPKRLQHDLIEPRNDATHAGYPLTDAQARTAVDMAVDVVAAAYPLSSLLPTQTTNADHAG
jgi:hypothetical protein